MRMGGPISDISGSGRVMLQMAVYDQWPVQGIGLFPRHRYNNYDYYLQ